MQYLNVKKDLWEDENKAWKLLTVQEQKLLLAYRAALLKDHMSKNSIELARYFYSKDFGCEIIPE